MFMWRHLSLDTFFVQRFFLQSSKGYVSYLDVSVGQKVAGYTTGLGRLDVMCQNPRNAVIHLGHSGGQFSGHFCLGYSGSGHLSRILKKSVQWPSV